MHILSCRQTTGERTATKLSQILEGAVGHDKITRFISEEEYTSKTLWRKVKPFVRAIENDDTGVLSLDDTIEEKPYTDENEIVSWHFDHCKGRSVKGINIVTSLVRYGETAVPIGFAIVKKDQTFICPKTKKVTRKATETKQMHFRNIISVAIQNEVKFEYVVADTWYASAENMEFIHKKKKKFCFPVKSNRLVSLSRKSKNYVQVEDLELKPDVAQRVYVNEVPFPVLLVKKVFHNKDGSIGVMYLVCNDTALNGDQIYAIYQKRWRIEEFHKSLKSNLGLAKSPTRTERTQSNHIFLTIYAYFKLEKLKLKSGMNHFALKTKLLLSALKSSFNQLQTMKECA